MMWSGSQAFVGLRTFSVLGGTVARNLLLEHALLSHSDGLAEESEPEVEEHLCYVDLVVNVDENAVMLLPAMTSMDD
eukprot:5645501-Amphidinium_carterae.1